jgi:hypothetical protein
MNELISVDLIQKLHKKSCLSEKSKRENEIVNNMNSYSNLLSEDIASNKLIDPLNFNSFEILKFQNKKKIIHLSNQLKNLENLNNLSFKKNLKEYFELIASLERVSDDMLKNKRDLELINLPLNENIPPLSEKLNVKRNMLKEIKYMSSTSEMKDNSKYKLSDSPVSVHESLEEDEEEYEYIDDHYYEEEIDSHSDEDIY